MATYLPMAMTVSKGPSVFPSGLKKYICKRQPMKEMAFRLLIRLESILGIAVVYHITRNVKILMGLYMGLWRHVSSLNSKDQ